MATHFFNYAQYDKLIKQREALDSTDTQGRGKIQQQIFAILKAHYETPQGNRSYKYRELSKQHTEAGVVREALKAQGIIRDLRRLNDDTRKEEIIDTSLVGYTQLKFVKDSLDYKMWTKDDIQPGVSDRTATHEDFVHQQSAIIDSMPKTLELCSDKEVKELFSTFTEHTWEGNTDNTVQYRNKAVTYIPQLFAALKKAKPIKLLPNEVSYKMLLVPTPEGGNAVVEFKYRDTFLAREKHDTNVSIRVFPTWNAAKEQLAIDIASMHGKKDALQNVYNTLSTLYQKNKKNDAKEFWSNFVDTTEEKLQDIYEGAYIQQAKQRIENTKQKKLSANQYALTIEGMLRDIEKSIAGLDAMIKRLSLYQSAKG